MAKKPKLPDKLYYKSGNGADYLTRQHFIARFKRDHDVKSDQVEGYMAHALADTEPEFPDEVPMSERKLILAKIKAARAAITFHWRHTEKVAEDEAKAAAEAKKATERLSIATAKGAATSEVIVTDFVSNMQRIVGNKFVVDSTSLHVREGATISADDIGEVIAKLAATTDGLDRMKGSALFQLGDALNFCVENFGDQSDIIIEQVVEVTGKQKHTVMEALRLARECPPDQRHPQLTATHHQEIINYRKGIKPAKLSKIIEEVIAGEARTITGPNGKQITQHRPHSVKRLREALQEAAGKSKEKKSKDANGDTSIPAQATVVHESPKASLGYLYMDTEDGTPYVHDVLSLDACASGKFIVIDLAANCLINSKGEEGDSIRKMADIWFDKKPQPVAQPKGKGKKQEKAHLDAIPD